MRHRSWIIVSLALVLAASLAGCGARKTANETSTATDSTAFATNPTEQGPGGITPEAGAPAPAPTPAPEPTPRRTTPKQRSPRPEPAAPAPIQNPGITVPTGTPLAITLTTELTSKTAKVGDAWTGVVKENVVVDGKTVIPSGSTVSGTVAVAKPAQRGDRAQLGLALNSLNVEGSEYRVDAVMEAVVAGSTRARNVGSVVGGAAAGALVGKAVSGSGKGAGIGGLLGGLVAGGAVARSEGYQVELKQGAEISFKTSQSVAIKR